MKLFKPLLISASLILILALAAPALAGDLKPCSLITKDEAAAILGEPVKAPRSGKVAGMAVGEKCAYYTAAPLAKRGGTGLVQLTVFTKDTLKGGMFSSPADYYARLYKAGSKAGAQMEEVAGLGEKAYWNPKGNTLHILAKGAYLQLKVSDLKKFSVPAAKAKELPKMISAHRKKLCVDAAKKYIVPKL
jgi:hypothetical protein